MASSPLVSGSRTQLGGWRAATLDPPERWYYRLSAASLAALEAAVSALHAPSISPTGLSASASLRETLRADLAPVREALDRGRGFAVQQGPDFSRGSLEEAKAFYWLLGQCLGEPLEQNVQGTLLYDVHDTGQSVEYGARFSVTNADSSFHTDASFADTQVDYVGLHCLRTARSGGVNQLVDGRTVVEELAATAPDVLDVLLQPFHVDRRGGVRPGESPTALRPVIQRTADGVIFRYLRYWIEVGHEKAGQPLTATQVRALDVLDETLRRPDLQAEFSLRAGEILWLDNRWLLHSRTAFEDHPEPHLRRHLVRLWLQQPRPEDDFS
jgi:alpha-ketoglutarate-dependent taurine dioxygenase